MEAKRNARALDLLTSREPAANLLRARALLGLEKLDEARQAYQDAVRGNPTLEDVDLANALASTARVVNLGGNGPALRVIANDDTALSETDRVLAPPQKTITFSDVGGLTEVKRQIHKRIIFAVPEAVALRAVQEARGRRNPALWAAGLRQDHARARHRRECKATFFSVAISDILDMYIGESERKLHAIFEKARTTTPAVLFFDELEALAGKRQFAREGTASKLVSQFLSEMDGFSQNNSGVLVLGATNVPWAVDAAFRRPGRFDRVLFVPPPD